MKQLHAQMAAVSKALAEVESSGDRADATSRNPSGRFESRVISRCHKRLAEAEAAKVEAEATIIKEMEDTANYQAQLAELEPLLTSTVGFRKADGPNNGVPEWLANTLSSIAKHLQESGNIDREAVAQSLLGLLVAGPPPTPPDDQTHDDVGLWTIPST